MTKKKIQIKFKKIALKDLPDAFYLFTPTTVVYYPKDSYIGYQVIVNGIRVGYIIKTQFSKKYDSPHKYLFVSSDLKEIKPFDNLKEAKSNVFDYIKRKSKNFQF